MGVRRREDGELRGDGVDVRLLRRPSARRVVGVLAVVALTAVNYFGIHRSAWLTRLIVTFTLLTLAVVVVACLAGGHATIHHLTPFRAPTFAGCCRPAGCCSSRSPATPALPRSVRRSADPARMIPRAVTIALLITLVVYAVVAVSALMAIGPTGLTATTAPLRAAVDAGRLHAVAPLVRIGGAVAALGSLLALILGVSRTTLAMARDRKLTDAIGRRASALRRAAPRRVGVSVVVVVLVATIDLRGAIGFSSFGVLAYYAIANASAMTLTGEEHRPSRWLPVLGLLGLRRPGSQPAARVNA